MNAIETHALSCRYWSKASLSDIFRPSTGLSWSNEVLHELNLQVPVGSLFALLGANGAGKTTLLKVLMNMLRPSSGRAVLLGTDSRRLGERELAQIGYVSEGQKLPEWMTVRQLLDYCRPFYPTWDSAFEAKLLAEFQLPTDRPLEHLSRGMRVKAALLSSLAARPRLLVLDEPFSGLDPVIREDVTHGLLTAVQLGETTAIISSHDIEEVERLADHVSLLEEGRLRLAEPTEDLLGRFRRVEVEQEGNFGWAPPPATWLNYEAAAGRVTFIDSAYERATTERACRERFPAATVRAHPMSLREIFITLARVGRKV